MADTTSLQGLLKIFKWLSLCNFPAGGPLEELSGIPGVVPYSGTRRATLVLKHT